MRDNQGRCRYTRELETELNSFFSSTPAVIPGFTDTSGFTTSNIIYESGKEFSPSYQMEATSSEIAQARPGNGSVFCAARIIYDDMRGNHRQTGVCLVFNFGLGAFLFPQNSRWNFHT